MRNVFRKTLPLLLTLVMLLGAVSTVHGANEPGLQNFTKPNTYSSGDFQDVKESDGLAASSPKPMRMVCSRAKRQTGLTRTVT